MKNFIETGQILRGSLLLSCFIMLAATGRAADAGQDAFYYNKQLGRGVNMGNALDAPREGEWGFTLQAEYFDLIKKAGFNSVRIPIRWSAHADEQPPYAIDPEFLKRVDWAIEQAVLRGLTVVINVHHYDGMDQEPAKHLPRLKAIWKQIAERYRGQPDRVYFELLNEPHDKLSDWDWARMIPELLDVIRQSNPQRIVIVGPSQWNQLGHLEALRLPDQDRFLIVTFHYYDPFHFTHQGASWAEGSEKWRGTTWDATPQQVEEIRAGFKKAADWAQKNQRPLFLGEFGAYSAADMDSRARWTRTVTREAEKLGISWTYWEFGSGFGVYDPVAKVWREPLLKALMDKP